jgi:pentatricopeptide repeat protein
VSVDRTKILEAAQKHLAKGAYDKAINEFQKLVKADPNDVRTWLKIGDLQAKRGSTREAVDTYAQVAEQYAAQGFFRKAVAVHKQILKLDPSRLDIQLKLAESYENLQLVSDALHTYEQVAATYARAGNIEKALELLGKMAELDPENIPIRIKLAEALSKAGKTKEAADAFDAGGRLLKAQGRIDDWIKVAERLLFHRTDDVTVARELSQLYLERNDPKRALAKLQICFKADPKDVPTLEMLAEAFRQLDQLAKTISVYREIARIHQEAGRIEERARTLSRILELDPTDAEARQALASYAPPEPRKSGPPSGTHEISSSSSKPKAAPRASSEEEVEEELEELDDEHLEPAYEEADQDEVHASSDDEDILIIDDDGTDLASQRPSAISQRAGSSPHLEASSSHSQHPASSLPPDIAREAQIAKLLTACEVFLRYGLKDKVEEQLRHVLELDARHVEARERLKDLLIERGETDGSIAELLVLSDLFVEERPSVARLYLKQALDLDPQRSDVRARMAALGEVSQSPLDSSDALLVASEAPDEAVFFVEEEESFETTQQQALTNPESAVLTVNTGRPEPSPAPRAAARSSLDEVTMPEPLDPLAPMSPEEFENAPLHSSVTHLGEERASRTSMPPGEVEELLEEADFFVAQGLYEEARAILRDFRATHPRNQLIADKIQEIDEIAAQYEQARSLAPPRDDLSFALAAQLADDLGQAEQQERNAGSDVLDIENVFAQFKKGVEKQVALEDTETHFDLGIAYKEMGLLQDAIAEFQLCLSNPQKQCIAHTMVGLCQLEKGDVADAIGSFKKGLYVEHKTDREELGLYFELGRAYELLHDPKEAIYYFEKVRKRDPAFRNVNDRIIALTRPSAPETTSPPALENDDIDAAFDDLIGDGKG